MKYLLSVYHKNYALKSFITHGYRSLISTRRMQTTLDLVYKNAFKILARIKDWKKIEPCYPLHAIKFIPGTDVIFSCCNSQNFHLHAGGGVTFQHTSHVMNRCIPHVHRALPLKGSKTVRIWQKLWNRIEYVLLTTLDGDSIFSSANRARPGSQELPWSVFMEWNFLRNNEEAYQIRE